MSRNIHVATWSGAPRASVIFVHGLGGHAYDTWRRAADDGSFWPLWLAEDVEGLTVDTLAYEAAPSNWLGTSMALQDRAVNVLKGLLSSPGLRDGPVAFICHSLGGLIVKQMLLDLDRQKGRRPEAAALLDRVTQVIFVATPHTGSRKGSLLDRLRFLAWPSAIARTLVANDPALRAINVSYRGLAQERNGSLRHLVLYETRGTQAGMIVDEASADPGLPGRPPIPIDADHIRIAKPADRGSMLYALVRDFVSEHPPRPGQGTGWVACKLPVINSEQSWNIAPKLLRVALLVALVAVGFKGVQAIIAPPVDPGRVEQKIDVVLALTQQLLANSATQPLPGAERAVRETVAATAQGAAAGDQRLQNALDLLKANKVAEAETLFRAVATDKAARIRQDSKDAAAAYLNLGAIAGLGDPKRALEAYRKAIELDGEDIESLLQVGWLELERGGLDEAERRFRRVLMLAKGDAQNFYLYWARLGLGDVEKARGSLANANSDYRQAGAIADRLAKADPGNAGWQRHLSVSYDKIGNVLVAQGTLPEALKSYRDSLAIRDRLAKADPGNAGWQRDLSVSYDKIGDVLVAQGNLPEALKSYRDGLAIADRLAKADPGNAGWQRDLSVSYAKIGDSLRKTGETADALSALMQGRRIIADLTQMSPDNAQWKQDLAWFDEQIA